MDKKPLNSKALDRLVRTLLGESATTNMGQQRQSSHKPFPCQAPFRPLPLLQLPQAVIPTGRLQTLSPLGFSTIWSDVSPTNTSTTSRVSPPKHRFLQQDFIAEWSLPIDSWAQNYARYDVHLGLAEFSHRTPIWPPRTTRSPPDEPRYHGHAIAPQKITYTQGLRDDRDPVIPRGQYSGRDTQGPLVDLSPRKSAKREINHGVPVPAPLPSTYAISPTRGLRGVRDEAVASSHERAACARAPTGYHPSVLATLEMSLQSGGAKDNQHISWHKTTQRDIKPDNQPPTLSHNGVTFTITAKIADGDTRRVVAAEHAGKLYAVKAVHKWHAFTTYWYTRADLFRERDALVRVSTSDGRTSYLLQLLMAWEEQEMLFFVMPFYPLDMRARLDSAPISKKDSHMFCVELIAAVQALRKLGIVHQDIKPQNILIDHDGHAVLSDFGLATVVGDRFYYTWRSWTECGTPAYIAPEVVSRDHVWRGHGAEVDVWSLGLVFLELLGLGDRWFWLVPSCEEARRLHEQYLPLQLALPADIGDMPSALLPKMLVVEPGERIHVDELHTHVPPDLWDDVQKGTQSHEWRSQHAYTPGTPPGRCFDFATVQANEERFAHLISPTMTDADLRGVFEEEQLKANTFDFEFLAPGAF